MAKSSTGTCPATDMRSQILNVAARMLCEAGFAGTTTRLIARECGIKAASLYHHFPSKDELVLEVLNEGIRQVDSAVRQALSAVGSGEPFRIRFLAAVRAHLQSFLGHSQFTAANLRTFKQAPADVQARNTILRSDYELLWRRLLDEGMVGGQLRADLDPRVMRLFLLGGMNIAVEWYQPGGLPIDDLAEQYVNLFIEGASASSRSNARGTALRAEAARSSGSTIPKVRSR